MSQCIGKALWFNNQVCFCGTTTSACAPNERFCWICCWNDWLHPRNVANNAVRGLNPRLRRPTCTRPRNCNEGYFKQTDFAQRIGLSSARSSLAGGVISLKPKRPCWKVTCEVLHLSHQGLILAHTPCPSLQQLMVTAWTSQCFPNFC